MDTCSFLISWFQKLEVLVLLRVSTQAESNSINISVLYSVTIDILDMFVWPYAPRSRGKTSWLCWSPASTVQLLRQQSFHYAVSDASGLFGPIPAFYLLLDT